MNLKKVAQNFQVINLHIIHSTMDLQTPSHYDNNLSEQQPETDNFIKNNRSEA